MLLLEVCLFLYFSKLSAGNGFLKIRGALNFLLFVCK